VLKPFQSTDKGYMIHLPDNEVLGEPKQETLEEAIKREYETRKFNSNFPFDPQSFKLGAKWQAERMYSEEEVKRLAFDFYYDMSRQMGVAENLISENATNVDVWFKKFKKK